MLLFKRSVLSTSSVIALITSLVVACAGKTPYPIPQSQAGDQYLNCEQIHLQIQDNQSKMLALVPQQNKMGKNVALGVAGAFFIVPWFFMDFSDAERIEIQGYELRNNYLMSLANSKHCGGMPAPIKFRGQ